MKVVVFARRRLKPDEIERLGLQRGQVVLCTLDEEAPTLGEAGQMIHMPPVGVIASTARRQSPNFEDRRMVVIKEPKFEVPTELRDLAAKAIDQTETAFGFFFDAARKSVDSIPYPTASISRRALSFIEQNMKAAFDHARKVVRLTNLQEATQIQSEFL
jgi:hypothetical protein